MLLVESERLLGPVELDPEPVLASGGDLADDDRPDRPRVGLELDEGGVFGRHPAQLAAARCCFERVTGLADSLWHGGQQPRSDALDAMAGNELGEVAPVRADVCERARRTAELLVHAPVGVPGAQEPVLQVRAVQQAQRTGLPARDALARLTHRRVVAVDERHGRVAPRLRRDVDEPLRAGGVECQRLLADHVLPLRQRGLGERQVKVVRRADVDNVDVRIADELFGRREVPLSAELGRRRASRLRRRGGDADQPCSRESSRPCVHLADEPGSCDRRAEELHPCGSLNRT